MREWNKHEMQNPRQTLSSLFPACLSRNRHARARTNSRPNGCRCWPSMKHGKVGITFALVWWDYCCGVSGPLFKCSSCASSGVNLQLSLRRYWGEQAIVSGGRGRFKKDFGGASCFLTISSCFQFFTFKCLINFSVLKGSN